MNKSMQTYTVRILNDEYALRSDESAEHIQHVARIVDAIMQEIVGNGSGMEVKKQAVLAALSLASKVVHLENQARAFEQRCTHLTHLVDRAL